MLWFDEKSISNVLSPYVQYAIRWKPCFSLLLSWLRFTLLANAHGWWQPFYTHSRSKSNKGTIQNKGLQKARKLHYVCSDSVYSFRTNQFKINLRIKNLWWKLHFLRIFCPNSYALLAVVRMVTKVMFAGKSIPNTYLKVYYKQRRYWVLLIHLCVNYLTPDKITLLTSNKQFILCISCNLNFLFIQTLVILCLLLHFHTYVVHKLRHLLRVYLARDFIFFGVRTKYFAHTGTK